jgi:phosphoglycerate-specific signal transduction histidine kinase
MNASVQAQMKLNLAGQTEADLSALQVSITGQAKCAMAAPMTTVGQTMTTISGQMIQISGQMVTVG